MRLAVATAILFIVLPWPFHHKPVVPQPSAADVLAQLTKSLEATCDQSPAGWFYVGKDGLVGFSPDSCDAARKDWKTAYGVTQHQGRS